MLRQLEGFDHYNSEAAMLRKGYTASGWVSQIAGRFGTGFAAQLNGATYRNNLDSQATWIVGFAYYTAVLVQNRTLLVVQDTATVQVSLELDSTGVLKIYRGLLATLLGTSSFVMLSNTWYYVELKVTINNSGTYEVRVGGVNILSGSADTQESANASANLIYVGATAVGNTRYDDWYIADTQAGQVTDFLGEQRIDTLFPDGAGGLQEWAPSAGSQFSCVDEVNPNDDTDYIFEATANDRSTFTLGALPVSGLTVNGVQINITCRKDDATAREIAPVWRQSATNHDGTTVAMTTSYLTPNQLYEVNPSTGIKFTEADINTNGEVGVKVVS